VVIAGDKKVKYQAVLKVMDELQRKAQVKRIGLLVEPKRQVSS
jgi:biopolymer transport protein TolR